MTKAALLSDHDLTERIFAHIANRSTDMGGEVWREPVANYRSPERLDAEIHRVLRRMPIPFCPSAALADIGSYIARDAAGVPIVVVRGEDRMVRAFQNICRHRGMRVAGDQGCAAKLVCGYHGWSYGLDGALRFVPGEQEGFPGLDKSKHGLKQLHAIEHGGLVFVAQAEEPDANWFDDIPLLIGPDQHVYSSGLRDTPANWKIVLEGFLEGYHIKHTHPESFLPYGFDNLNVVETFGRHARVIFPFQRIEKLRDVAPEERRVSGYLTKVHHIFPNALVIQLSSHTIMLVIEPNGVAAATTHAYLLTNRGRDEEALAAAKKDGAFVSQTGAEEDRAMVTAIQHGMSGDANEVFTFGRFEAAIVHFHRNMAAALAEGTVSGTTR